MTLLQIQNNHNFSLVQFLDPGQTNQTEAGSVRLTPMPNVNAYTPGNKVRHLLIARTHDFIIYATVACMVLSVR